MQTNVFAKRFMCQTGIQTLNPLIDSRVNEPLHNHDNSTYHSNIKSCCKLLNQIFMDHVAV